MDTGRATLRVALFAPQGESRGSVVLSPGRGEPIEKYAEVVGELLRRGFNVLAHDWRGQGLSSRSSEAHPIEGWKLAPVYLRDFETILAGADARLPRPWIALAHSMGAGLIMSALVRGELRFSAAVLSAPMILIRTLDHPPARVRRLARLMQAIGRGASSPLPPHVFGSESFDTNILTHDPERWERGAALLERRPELRVPPPSWSWLRFALDLDASLRRRSALAAMRTPFVVIAAGDDRLCVNTAAADLARAAPHGRYVEIEHAFHEILMETDDVRRVFWREFDAIAEAAAPARSAVAV